MHAGLYSQAREHRKIVLRSYLPNVLANPGGNSCRCEYMLFLYSHLHEYRKFFCRVVFVLVSCQGVKPSVGFSKSAIRTRYRSRKCRKAEGPSHPRRTRWKIPECDQRSYVLVFSSFGWSLLSCACAIKRASSSTEVVREMTKKVFNA